MKCVLCIYRTIYYDVTTPDKNHIRRLNIKHTNLFSELTIVY